MAEIPPVPDGPDTELTAAIAWFRDNPDDLDYIVNGESFMHRVGTSRDHAATIVRAVLARPAAGRDLTAQASDTDE